MRHCSWSTNPSFIALAVCWSVAQHAPTPKFWPPRRCCGGKRKTETSLGQCNNLARRALSPHPQAELSRMPLLHAQGPRHVPRIIAATWRQPVCCVVVRRWKSIREGWVMSGRSGGRFSILVLTCWGRLETWGGSAVCPFAPGPGFFFPSRTSHGQRQRKRARKREKPQPDACQFSDAPPTRNQRPVP